MHRTVIELNRTLRKPQEVELRAGDVVKVHRRIREGEKERTQIFEGMIIAIKGRQSSSPMLTVRKVSYGIGVELIVPLFSPSIEKVELVKRAHVRRAKLYYVREKSAKSLRFKYQEVKEQKKEEKESTPTENTSGKKIKEKVK